MRYVLIFGFLAFLFYGSGTGNFRFLEDRLGVNEYRLGSGFSEREKEPATFEERWQRRVVDASQCDCELDEDE